MAQTIRFPEFATGAVMYVAAEPPVSFAAAHHHLALYHHHHHHQQQQHQQHAQVQILCSASSTGAFYVLQQPVHHQLDHPAIVVAHEPDLGLVVHARNRKKLKGMADVRRTTSFTNNNYTKNDDRTVGEVRYRTTADQGVVRHPVQPQESANKRQRECLAIDDELSNLSITPSATRRRAPVTSLRNLKSSSNAKGIDWKRIPGFWHDVARSRLAELASLEEEMEFVADRSQWLSSSEVAKQFKLKVTDVASVVARTVSNLTGEYLWEPSGVRARAALTERTKQIAVFENYIERMAKLDFLLKENGVTDFEQVFYGSPLIREACGDFIDPEAAKPKMSQFAALKNVVGLSEMSQAFPQRYHKTSVLRQYVAENVFVVDCDGLLVDKKIRTQAEASKFVLRHLERSKLVVTGLIAAAAPLGEMLGDPSGLIKAFSDDDDFIVAFSAARSRTAVERIVFTRLAKKMQLEREEVEQLVIEKQVKQGAESLLSLAHSAPCNKLVGVDRCVREMEFLLTTTPQSRSEVLMSFLHDAFENVDEPALLFDRFPFLREYTLGKFGGGLAECEACVPIAMALNEMDAYDASFEAFRANLRAKVCKGYTWQRAVKSVMSMKLARGMPFTLGDVYASL